MADPVNDYASINLLQIEDDRGVFVDFEDARNFDYDVTKDRKVINTMNRRHIAKGFQSGTLMVSGTVEVPQRKGEPEYNFHRALVEDRLLQIYVERDDGGKRFIIQDAMISGVAPSSNESGEATERISWIALNVIEDATQVFGI